MKSDFFYGFSNEKVNSKFEGGMTYCNTFCVSGNDMPVAVYKVDSPNREKGHKDYLLLSQYEETLLINGMNKDEMEQNRYQMAIMCANCQDVIWSCYRHDFKNCQCGCSTVDGGKDYLHWGGSGIPVKYDLIEDKLA